MKLKKIFAVSALILTFALLTTLFAAATAEAGVVGGAPVAENLELATYRGVSVGGMLSAKDPEGGKLTFQITTKPGKGTIDLSEDGHFVYTPADGKRGKDYFGYKAIDQDGNYSQEATVIIKIQKQGSKITYSDTAGTGSAYAAVRLAEEDVFTGENLAGAYVFSPDASVSRQEFLAMCMKLSGKSVIAESVRTTGFADDAAIAVWAKPYVNSALRYGIVSGYSDDGTGVVFDPDREISVVEAAVMLDRALGLTDAVTTWFGYEGSVPAWALQSASNVSACGLLPYGCSYADETLSRGEAAEMLCAAMDVMAKR